MFTFWLALTIATARKPDISIPSIRDPVISRPSTKGAYCCDSYGGNKVGNGNFEYGNALFSSEYSYGFDTVPGKYVVTDSATQFGADVNDHSYCESSTGYPTNQKFLLVNGLASLSAGSTAVIWEQTIGGLKSGSEYRFCGNFKNLPQCTFDVIPKVTVKLSTGVSHTVTINTDPDDQCEWQLISFCFVAEEKVTVKILLNEDSLGDGNDLAIDDISVQELVDPQLSTTVLHQWGSQTVIASINSLFDPSDDYLPYDPAECDLPWYWFVLTWSGGNVNWSKPYGFGNFVSSVRYNPFSFGSSWDLTTDFPGFTFAWGEMYLVGMVTHRCCEGCIDDGWTYHVVNINSNPFGDRFPFGDRSPFGIGGGNGAVSHTEKDSSSLQKTLANIKSGVKSQDVSVSSSGEEGKDRMVDEKDLHRVKDLALAFERSSSYKKQLENYELSKSREQPGDRK